MLKSNVKDRDYRQFPSIVKFLASNRDMITYNPNKCIEEIESVDSEILKRFQDLKILKTLYLFSKRLQKKFQRNRNFK